MPDSTILDLPAAGPLIGAEVVPIVQSGANVRTTLTAIGAGTAVIIASLDGRLDTLEPEVADNTADIATLVSGKISVGAAAGGVLSGTYPDPAFAANMATQAELDAAIAAVRTVATDVIWDVKGDSAIGTGADTAIRLPIGADGQVRSADSTTASGQSWRSITYNRRTGAVEYFLPDGTTTPTIVAVQSKLYFLPLRVNSAYTIDRLAINVTTLAASSSGRFGLWASTNGRPGAKLQDTGAAAVDTTTTGDKETPTVAWAVTPGLYWLGIVFQGGAPTVRGMGNYPSDVSSVIGTATLSDLTAGTPQAVWAQLAVTGVLPGPAVPIYNSSAFPRVIVRVT